MTDTPADRMEMLRELNRVRVRRHYHRKAKLLKGLRDQKTELETQLRQLMLLRTTQYYGESAANTTASYTPQLPQLTISTTTHLHHIEQKLVSENDHLHCQLQKHHEQWATLRNIIYAENALWASHDDPLMGVKPLSVRDCNQLRVDALRRAPGFYLDTNHVPPRSMTMGSLGGWSGVRLTQDGVFRFSVRKTIIYPSFDTICKYTWATFSDPGSFAKLFSRSMEIQCQMLQNIDENNFVMLHQGRGIAANNQEFVMRKLDLVTQTITRTGYCVILRGLERDRLLHSGEDPDAAKEIWIDFLCCLQCEKSAHGTICTISGESPTMDAYAHFWMAEFLLIAMQWETIAVGPRMILAQ